MVDALWTDLRFAVRRLRSSPAFSFVVVATIALAIGASTTVFSLLNAIVLRKVPVRSPAGLVSISTSDVAAGPRRYIYADTLVAFRTQQRSFSELSMYSAGSFRIEARGSAIDANVEGVMPGYFRLLDVRASTGRLLADGDLPLARGAAQVVVISDRLWRRMFSADPRAVGDPIRIDGRPMTVVGITEPGFFGIQADGGSDLFVPFSTIRVLAQDASRALRARDAIGRLATGATIEQARAELLARWPAIQAATIPPAVSGPEQRALRALVPDIEAADRGISLLRRQYGRSLVVVVGSSLILLAIGCVNLTGLVLARAMRRQQQLAVQLALGASRARLTQQIVLEGIILAVIGLAIALPIVWWSIRTLTAMMSIARTTALRPLTPDVRVLVVAAVATVAAGLMIGVLPAWRAAAAATVSARHGRTLAGSLGRSGRLLLVAQIALSMVLLVGAALFARSLSNLHANAVSFRGRPVLWTRLAQIPGDRTTLGRPYWQELTRQLTAIRGAEGAALSSYFPAYLGYPGSLPTDGYAAASDPAVVAPGLTELVSPGLFEMFGIARLRGRDFTWDDDQNAPAVAIVSRSLALKLFSSVDVVGRRLLTGSGAARSEIEIVGVAANTPIGTIREPTQAVVFRPMLQDLAKAQFPLAHVRVSGDLNAARDGYVRAVESQGHHYVRGLFTLDQWIDYALLQERLTAGLSIYAGALTVLLGCIGVYGLLAYAVAVRVREIGVRMALGATRADVIGMITREGLAIAAGGVLLGVPAAIAAGRLVRSQLYDVAPNNPAPIVGAALVFLMTGLAAAWLPAVRASRLDPMDALRQE